MKIKVIAVELTPRQGTKSTYMQAEVSYKNLDSNKTESKKLMDFSDRAVYNTIANAKKDEVFDVISQKDGQYWKWVSVTSSNADNAQAAPVTSGFQGTKTNATATKSTYETQEERARKQIYIVRQSSLSTAADILSVGAKTPPTKEAVVEMAKFFEDYVFDGLSTAKEEVNLDPALISEDIPY